MVPTRLYSSSRFLGTIRIISCRPGQLCPRPSYLESSCWTGGDHRCFPITGRCFVERRPPILRIFLAPTHCSRRSLWCCDGRNSPDTCPTGSARGAAPLDRVRRRSGCAGCSFQGSCVRGSISAAAFFCHPGLASTKALALACGRPVCGDRSGPPHAGEPFPCRTGYPFRFQRCCLVLENIGKEG